MSLAAHALRYCAAVLVSVSLCLGGLFTLNALVDPLWYFGGNQLSDKNFAYNERFSKVNLALQQRDEIDCLILGSSRMTLLDGRSIKDSRCFNLSVSGGLIDDSLILARYLKERGLTPSRLIVSAEEFNFVSPYPTERDMPAHIKEDRDPPSPLIAYTSFSSTAMSIRSLRGRSDVARFYDASFTGRVHSNLPPYSPNLDYLKSKTPEDAWHITPERVALFRDLKRVFPEAEFIILVPPVSIWLLERRVIQAPGGLEAYIGALKELREIADAFYDFAVPSEVTIDPRTTYDGSHFYPWVMDRVAASINQGEALFGVEPHSVVSKAEYTLLYTKPASAISQLVLGEPTVEPPRFLQIAD